MLSDKIDEERRLIGLASIKSKASIKACFSYFTPQLLSDQQFRDACQPAQVACDTAGYRSVRNSFVKAANSMPVSAAWSAPIAIWYYKPGLFFWGTSHDQTMDIYVTWLYFGNLLKGVGRAALDAPDQFCVFSKYGLWATS